MLSGIVECNPGRHRNTFSRVGMLDSCILSKPAASGPFGGGDRLPPARGSSQGSCGPSERDKSVRRPRGFSRIQHTTMKITRLTVSNFRCFGEKTTVINLESLTALIGGNACGKTAAMAALARLFGVAAGDRGIRKSDFHVPHDADLAAITELSLFIEARIEFPELEDEEATEEGVPEVFPTDECRFADGVTVLPRPA